MDFAVLSEKVYFNVGASQYVVLVPGIGEYGNISSVLPILLM